MAPEPTGPRHPGTLRLRAWAQGQGEEEEYDGRGVEPAGEEREKVDKVKPTHRCLRCEPQEGKTKTGPEERGQLGFRHRLDQSNRLTGLGYLGRGLGGLGGGPGRGAPSGRGSPGPGSSMPPLPGGLSDRRNDLTPVLVGNDVMGRNGRLEIVIRVEFQRNPLASQRPLGIYLLQTHLSIILRDSISLNQEPQRLASRLEIAAYQGSNPELGGRFAVARDGVEHRQRGQDQCQ